MLQNNGGDDITVSAKGPFTFSNMLANGKLYAVTVKTQPAGQTCRVTGGGNGTGGGTTANGQNVTNITVNCSYPRYAYVVNHDAGTVSTYAVDAASGRLKWIGKADTGTNPQAVTIAPSGKFAYVANNGSNTVSEYAIAADGSLSPILGNASVGTGTYPVSVAVHPSGKYAYVANQDGTVSQYTVGGTDGSLSAMLTTTTTSSVTAGQLPASVTIGPAGKYAYVANSGDNTVSEYAVGSDGGLTPLATPTVVTGTGPYGVTIASSGKYAYVVNHNGGATGSVSEYAVGADGSLTLLASLAEPTGTSPVSITLDPTGQYAYVANSGDDTVSQYSIGANGILTPMSPPTVATGSGPTGVVVDPTGTHAYVTNAAGNTVSEYAIASDGTLSALAPATLASDAAPRAITLSQGTAAVQTVPTFAYVANSGDGSVSPFTIGTDGKLASLGSPATAGASPVAVTVSPSGHYAYVLNGGGTDLGIHRKQQRQPRAHYEQCNRRRRAKSDLHHR